MAVVTEFRQRRKKGLKITKLWLCKTMKHRIQDIYGTERATKFKASNNWFHRLRNRYQISLRNRTNKKQKSADDCRSTIQSFHRTLRKALKTQWQRMHGKTTMDAKRGRWLPANRYNIDQVPLPFAVDQGETYAETGEKQIWISQPMNGLEKRQATLQLCIRAKGEQTVKPAIIFRGKGNVTLQELAKHDKHVDVYFQKNAWMDNEINLEWTENTLVPGVADKSKESVIFADNVSFQLRKEFHEACRTKCNAVVYMLPEYQTDKVQPIDAGIGRFMKLKIGNALDKWLEIDEKVEKWHGKMSAKERRILMTKLAGDAWDEMQHYKDIFRKAFKRTGCLMTVDGSGDNLVRPQGIEHYEF
ncbi:uncharacterized protein LOC135687930 [Rhopilema esculentum]|uniref:uncharacterized protein LOC135687930 n=1 Tax=Rhopilema esculentum TaxID=499914 RepID=UPI0031D9302F